MPARLLALAFAASALCAHPASAQPASAEARAHFERGVEHAAAERWEPALDAFRASFARYERARTLFNIVVALDRLERGPEALEAIERLLAREDVDPADRREAETLRARWQERLARERPAIRPAPEPEAAGVRLRPLDRATVRLVALRGAEMVRPANRGEQATAVPRASHGSGVVVHPDGWVLTARHVVEGADRLVALLPGEIRAVPATVVWVDPERDLAFVRLGEPAEAALALAPPPSLELGQAVDASGYPLDATERWPNASSGQVGRPLNDGRVQLSIALNPGNSGGPVAVDGALIGIVSQGGDPERGVQGVVVMEPIGPVVGQLDALRAQSGAAPGPDATDDVLVELIGAAPAPPVGRRLARLRAAAAQPLADARGALWALEAEATRRTILRDAGVRMPSALPPDLRASFDEATELASTMTHGFAADDSLVARYGVLAALAAPVRRGEWECGLSGVCTQRLEPEVPGRGWLFDLTLAGGLAVDDDQRASFVEGAMFSLLGLFHLGNWGLLDPMRFNIVLGAEASLGTWREEVAFSFLADLGVRWAIGSPDFSVAFQLLYTPGFVAAETRWAFAYLGYRATVSVQLPGAFGIGVSWRELGRGADDTQRSLELYLSWGW